MSSFKRPDVGETRGSAALRAVISGLAKRARTACPQPRLLGGLIRVFRAQSCEGIAAIEFAMVLPFMVGVFIGVWDFGRVIHENARFASAAGAGAQYAFHFENDQPGWVQAARDDAEDNANELAITTDVFCECSGTIPPVPVACTATCGNPPASPARNVSIQVVGTVDLLFNYGVLQNPLPITKQAIIRVE